VNSGSTSIASLVDVRAEMKRKKSEYKNTREREKDEEAEFIATLSPTRGPV
jgi:hypothetical protein